MITLVDVRCNGRVVASFSWHESKDYYGWNVLRDFAKTLGTNDYTVEVRFDKEETSGVQGSGA